MLSKKSIFLIGIFISAYTSASPLQPRSQTGTHNNRTKLTNNDIESLFGTRIIGGSNASPGEFPWQVSLQEIKFGGIYPFCGGAILNQRTILTAAHCVDGWQPSEFNVVAGAHNIYNPDGNEQSVSVSDIKMHEGFDSDTYDNDIALVTLSSALSYTSRVKNVALPSAGIVPTGTCIAVGWGNVRNDGGEEYAEILQKVELDIVERVKCEEILDDINPITMGMICGNRSYKGTCKGDSGSGFLCKSTSGNPYLAGVVSWGVDVPHCVSNPDYPSVFTNMAHYANWIKSVSEFS